MPNAFAMGRSKKRATVCVTTGIMEILSPAELEGVLAHELAHIRHRDVVIMTIASFFASIASMIFQFGFFFGGGDDDENPGFLVVILVSLAVYVISFFLMQALSRYREFAADRGAAEITRRPTRAGVGAHEDQRHDGAHPAAGPARALRARGVLHLAADEEVGVRPVLDAPADGEADRGAAEARGAAPGRPRSAWASSTPCSGRSRTAKPAKTDRLFALSTAHVTLSTEHGIESGGRAGLVFQAERDERLRDDRHATPRRSCARPARRPARRSRRPRTTSATAGSSSSDPDVEDLVVGVNAIKDALDTGGYGDRVLAAVFKFTRERPAGLLHLQRQARAPGTRSCPAPGQQQRNTERELQLKAQLGNELPFEPELERWFPLWGVPL